MASEFFTGGSGMARCIMRSTWYKKRHNCAALIYGLAQLVRRGLRVYPVYHLDAGAPNSPVDPLYRRGRLFFEWVCQFKLALRRQSPRFVKVSWGISVPPLPVPNYWQYLFAEETDVGHGSFMIHFGFLAVHDHVFHTKATMQVLQFFQHGVRCAADNVVVLF
jgi:hypothetical protein